MNERDPELEALWRARSTETPPSSLDDAIRAAAHRAVHAKPVPAARARAPWPSWAPIAAAASIGVIAIGVWQLQPKDTDVMTATVTDIPAARVAATPRASAPASPAAPARSPAPASRDTAAAAERKGGVAAATERKDESEAPSTDAKRAAPAQPSTAMVVPPAGVQRAAPAQRSETMVSPPPSASAPSTNAPNASAPAADAPMIMVAPPPAPAAPMSKVAPAPLEPAPVAGPSMAAGALSDKRALDASERDQTSARQEAGAIAGARKDVANNARMAATPSSTDGGNAPMRSKALAQSDAMERAAPAPSPAARQADNARSIASYVDAIRHALDAHQIDLAVAQLTAMRAQYPDADAKLPMELRVWAATVPRDNP